MLAVLFSLWQDGHGTHRGTVPTLNGEGQIAEIDKAVTKEVKILQILDDRDTGLGEKTAVALDRSDRVRADGVKADGLVFPAGDKVNSFKA